MNYALISDVLGRLEYQFELSKVDGQTSEAIQLRASVALAHALVDEINSALMRLRWDLEDKLRDLEDKLEAR